MNELMNDRGDCKTALATPNLYYNKYITANTCICTILQKYRKTCVFVPIYIHKRKHLFIFYSTSIGETPLQLLFYKHKEKQLYMFDSTDFRANTCTCTNLETKGQTLVYVLV